MSGLEDQRRFFAEEVEAYCGLRTTALVDAFATVPRERYLGPGPWLVKVADGDMFGPPRPTPDADPRRIYHNVVVAIDASRQLYNGHPGTIGAWIDQLDLAAGARVVHVGCGTGYYTALMAHCAGTHGHVLAFEADEALAARARDNLAGLAQVEVRPGTAAALEDGWDAVLINAGVSHPLDAWLDALRPGGRMVVPITFSFGPSPIGKGVVVLVTRREVEYEARGIGFVAIYGAVGVRDEGLNERIGAALRANPMPRLTRLRREQHEAAAECWLHGDGFCLSTTPAG